MGREKKKGDDIFVKSLRCKRDSPERFEDLSWHIRQCLTALKKREEETRIKEKNGFVKANRSRKISLQLLSTRSTPRGNETRNQRRAIFFDLSILLNDPMRHWLYFWSRSYVKQESGKNWFYRSRFETRSVVRCTPEFSKIVCYESSCENYWHDWLLVP